LSLLDFDIYIDELIDFLLYFITKNRRIEKNDMVKTIDVNIILRLNISLKREFKLNILVTNISFTVNEQIAPINIRKIYLNAKTKVVMILLNPRDL